MIILKPLINEKSMSLTKQSFYTFEVSHDATKRQIGKEVADKFGVEVLSVNIINIAGRKKTQRARRRFYFTGDQKKAVVSIRRGQRIEIFESVGVQEGVEVKTAEAIEQQPKEKKSLLRGTKIKIEKAVKLKKEPANKKEKI